MKYVSAYCPTQGSSLIAFTNANEDATELTDSLGTQYLVSVANLPEAYKVPGKVFYIKYHTQNTTSQESCSTLVLNVKSINVDSFSTIDCNADF
ncbi:hypothetical protein [Pedobacter sp. MW01-1-1]|uniref:hypothetical protein n=1 Tax=Pedobacter sp. MW01-1-1 TaxID=3383027 RepID=UPI003FED7C75